MNFLNKMGIKSKSAFNGQEALDMLLQDTNGFDLVFMDIQMPVLDGIEATRKIREMKIKGRVIEGGGEKGGEKLITIVGLSANATKHDRDMCKESGMNDYVPKPFTFDQIRNIVEKYIIQNQKK
eukprot:TRINITY_DN10154_c0_g1_i1.p1 TRINITY_DN10154_c0_g1~~TRINITY_DN10154_c0_g1_i1.p1  ORF type:complete len:124 (+),score=43.03 TRINITY_DN10154_c0_g1_i1:84-455(+)